MEDYWCCQLFLGREFFLLYVSYTKFPRWDISSKSPFFLYEHHFRFFRSPTMGKNSCSGKWTTLFSANEQHYFWPIALKELRPSMFQKERVEGHEIYGFSFLYVIFFEFEPLAPWLFSAPVIISLFFGIESSSWTSRSYRRSHWCLAASNNRKKEEKNKFSR